MPLKEQQKAPDFQLESTSENKFKLSEQAGEPIILFFYPKNFTKVCTAEVCEFRDAFSEFRDLNVKVVGISQDTIDSHHKFKKENKLPFELLSDPKGKVAKLFKATIPVIGMNRRVTYLLDKDLKIKEVYENMFSADQHVKEMIEKM
ncbi:peroxiredoxin [Marivirga tractuosa]|uniref:peroxiredoxin n=1 Tax=Marivirga tractuosa TaxID=1006 RepID=UPI0035D124C0